VVITGIKASLQKSLDVKQKAIGVVDAISAEDIGQFPDANLAEAIQRIPGVTVARGAASVGGVPVTTGDATQITVRGFGPTFNETLFDGRQIASPSGTQVQGAPGLDRGFDFSSVGSNFVSEVDVLKTPDATLSSGAIGASVNIKFPKPFDSPGLKLAATGSASDSINDGQVTPTGGLLFSNTFADNTFGILAFADYSEHETKTNHINSQGWEGFLLAPSQLLDAPAGASKVGSLPSWYIQDYGIYREYTNDERKDGRLVLQWHPSDDLMITLDDTIALDTIRETQYGYSVWFNSGSLTDVVRGSDGTLTSFVQPNTPTDFQGQVNGSVTKINTAGLNVAYNINSAFKLALDVDQSKAWLNPGGQLSDFDADVGYGPQSSAGRNGTNLGIAGVGTNSLPYPTAYGPGGNASLFLDPNIIGSHVFPMQSFQNTDRINQFKVEGTWADGDTNLKFGLQYTDDKRDIATYDTFTNNDWQAYAGYGSASNNPHGVPLPPSFLTGSFSTANFIPGFANSGSLPPYILAISPYTILNYLNSLNGVGANYGAAPGFTGKYQLALNPQESQNLTETTYSPYINLTQSTHLGSMILRSAFGVRYEITSSTSGGLATLPVSLQTSTADQTLLTPVYGPLTPVSTNNSYKYLLPSLDLNLGVTDDVKVRFDASRTLTRPPLNDINPALNVTATQRVNALTAIGGNPNLLPFLSDNLDLGVEWYYSKNDYAAVDVFLKEVTDFIVQTTSRQTINGVIDPTTNALAQFSVSTYTNGPAAEVRGVELALQHMFWDSGFGMQANATFVSTDRPYDPFNLTVSEFALPGLANSFNFVAFYEKYGFHARVAVNHRGEYLDSFNQHQITGIYGSEPVFVAATTQVDFSTSYDLNRHLSIFFEGLNLNDAIYETHGRFSEQVLDVLDYGPRLTLGFRAKL